MTKNFEKQVPRQPKRDETAAVVAAKHGVSDRYVRMVMSGDRENQAILDDCIEYRQRKNLLMHEVLKLVPFKS